MGATLLGTMVGLDTQINGTQSVPLQGSHTRQEVDKEHGEEKSPQPTWGREGFMEEATFQLSFERKGGRCSSQEVEVDESLPGNRKSSQLAWGGARRGRTGIGARAFPSVPYRDRSTGFPFCPLPWHLLLSSPP